MRSSVVKLLSYFLVLLFLCHLCTKDLNTAARIGKEGVLKIPRHRRISIFYGSQEKFGSNEAENSGNSVVGKIKLSETDFIDVHVPAISADALSSFNGSNKRLFSGSFSAEAVEMTALAPLIVCFEESKLALYVLQSVIGLFLVFLLLRRKRRFGKKDPLVPVALTSVLAAIPCPILVLSVLPWAANVFSTCKFWIVTLRKTTHTVILNLSLLVFVLILGLLKLRLELNRDTFLAQRGEYVWDLWDGLVLITMGGFLGFLGLTVLFNHKKLLTGESAEENQLHLVTGFIWTVVTWADLHGILFFSRTGVGVSESLWSDLLLGVYVILLDKCERYKYVSINAAIDDSIKLANYEI
jgi:hypothetical protein